MATARRVPVVVLGAGTVGKYLACALAHNRVPCILVDKLPREPVRHPHPRAQDATSPIRACWRRGARDGRCLPGGYARVLRR